MRWHTVDYAARGDHKPRGGVLVDRGFWLYLRRPLAVCTIRGHVPVVDGTEGFNGRPGHRWVCCDRCGLRPQPQGSLDPAVWDIGAPAAAELPRAPGVIQPVGPWPVRDEGVLGGQLIIGRATGAGFSFKVGNAGSEHTLAAHVSAPPVGALYLHTERFGTWLQRRLVPDGYESRVTEAHIHDKHLSWRIWAPRDHSVKGWRSGYVPIDPRDIAWGPKRYSYEPAGDPVLFSLLVEPGEKQYPVTMRLKRQTLARKGRPKAAVRSWTVSCDTEEAIPYGGRHGGMMGWSVPVSDHAAETMLWPVEAAAASQAKIRELRAGYEWQPADARAGA